MHLRPWRDERHQTPKSDLLVFRFAASICTLSRLGLSNGIECVAAANPKGAPFSPLAFKLSHVCAITVIPMQDRMINPDLERFMTKRAQSQVIELPGSHAIFLSHAPEVAALIEKAATEAK